MTAADRPASPTFDDSPAQTVVDGAVESSPGASSQAATIPTVVVSPQELAAREAAKARETPLAIPHVQVERPVGKKRSLLVPIGAVVIVLLLVVGAGGFALIKYLSSHSNGKPSAANANTNTDVSAPMHEVARYWIEVNAEGADGANRAGDLIKMRSGQEFKFHFSPSDNGYLYIIGPGAKNAPTIFLSAQPGAMSGLDTNEVRSGTDFTFPSDSILKANFIRLDETPGTDEFTFVFSPSPISAPAFFAGPSQHPLTSEELKHWDSFLAQAKANAATIEVIKTGASPFVSVKVPQTASEGEPVVFSAVGAAWPRFGKFDEVLVAGDTLYLPRGYIHAAEALGETCIHLTVGIQPYTRHALVEAMEQRTIEHAMGVDDQTIVDIEARVED